MTAPGSPGSSNGGCTGFIVTLALPHDPTQKEETYEILESACSHKTLAHRLGQRMKAF